MKRHPQWLAFSRDRRRRTGYRVSALQDPTSAASGTHRGTGGEARYRQNAEALGVLLEEGRAVHVSPRAATGWFHERVAQAEAAARRQSGATDTAPPTQGSSTQRAERPPSPVVSRAASCVHVDVQVTKRQQAARQALFHTPFKRISHVSSEPRKLKPLPKRRPAKNEVDLVKRHVNARRLAQQPTQPGSPPSVEGDSGAPDKRAALKSDALPTLLSPIKPKLASKLRLARRLLGTSSTSAKPSTGALDTASAKPRSQWQQEASPSLSPTASAHASTVRAQRALHFADTGQVKQSRLSVLTSQSASDSNGGKGGVGEATGLQSVVESMALGSNGDERHETTDSLFSISVRSVSISSPSAAHRHAEREASYNPLGQLRQDSHQHRSFSTRSSVAHHSTFGEHSVHVTSAYAVWALFFLRRTLRQLLAMHSAQRQEAVSQRNKARDSTNIHRPVLLEQGSDLSAGMANSSQGPVFWRRQATALRAAGLGRTAPSGDASQIGPSADDATRTTLRGNHFSFSSPASPSGSLLNRLGSPAQDHEVSLAESRGTLSPLGGGNAADTTVPHTQAALPSSDDEARAHRIAIDAAVAGGGALGYGSIGVYPLPAGSSHHNKQRKRTSNALVAGRQGAKAQVQAVITAAQLSAAQDVLPLSALRFLGISGDAVRAAANTSSMHQLMLDTLEAAEMKRSIAIAYAHGQCLSSLKEAQSQGVHKRRGRACMLAMSQRDVQSAKEALAHLKRIRRAEVATDEALAGLGIAGAPPIDPPSHVASNPTLSLRPLPTIGTTEAAGESAGPQRQASDDLGARAAAGLEGMFHAAVTPLLLQANVPNPQLALSMAKAQHKTALAASKNVNVGVSAFKKSAFGVRPYQEVLVASGACTRVTLEATAVRVELTLSDTVTRRAVTQLERHIIVHPPSAPNVTGGGVRRFDADSFVDHYFAMVCAALRDAKQQRKLSSLETGEDGTIRGDKDTLSVTLSLHHAQLCRLPHLTLTQRCSVAMLFQEFMEARVLLAVQQVDAAHCATLERGGLPLPQLPVRSLSKLRSSLSSLLARGKLSDAFVAVVRHVCDEPRAYDVVQLVADGHGPSAAGLLEAAGRDAPAGVSSSGAQLHTNEATERANAATAQFIQQCGVFAVFLQPYQLSVLLEEVNTDSRALAATKAISQTAHETFAGRQRKAPTTLHSNDTFDVHEARSSASHKAAARHRPWRNTSGTGTVAAGTGRRPVSAVSSHSRATWDAPAFHVPQSAARHVLRAQRALLAWGRANQTHDSQEVQRQQALSDLATRRLQHAQAQEHERQSKQREEQSRLAVHAGAGLGGSVSVPNLPSARALAAEVAGTMQGGRTAAAVGARQGDGIHTSVAKGGILQDANGDAMFEAPAPAVVQGGGNADEEPPLRRYGDLMLLQEHMSRFKLEPSQANRQLQLMRVADPEGGIAANDTSAMRMQVWERCALLGDILVLLLTVSKPVMQQSTRHAAVVRRSLHKLLQSAFVASQHGRSGRSASSTPDSNLSSQSPPETNIDGLESDENSSSDDDSGDMFTAQRASGHLRMDPQDELDLLAEDPSMRSKALRAHPSLAACKVLLGSACFQAWLARTAEVALQAGPMVLTAGKGPGATPEGGEDPWQAQQLSLGLMCPAPVLLGLMGSEFLHKCGLPPAAIRAAASVAFHDGFSAAAKGNEDSSVSSTVHDSVADALAAVSGTQSPGGELLSRQDVAQLPSELFSAAASLRQAGQHVREMGVTATCEEMTLAAQLWVQRLVDAVMHELVSLLSWLQVPVLDAALRVPQAAEAIVSDGSDAVVHVVPLMDYHAWLAV